MWRRETRKRSATPCRRASGSTCHGARPCPGERTLGCTLEVEEEKKMRSRQSVDRRHLLHLASPGSPETHRRHGRVDLARPQSQQRRWRRWTPPASSSFAAPARNRISDGGRWPSQTRWSESDGKGKRVRARGRRRRRRRGGGGVREPEGLGRRPSHAFSAPCLPSIPAPFRRNPGLPDHPSSPRRVADCTAAETKMTNGAGLVEKGDGDRGAVGAPTCSPAPGPFTPPRPLSPLDPSPISPPPCPK